MKFFLKCLHAVTERKRAKQQAEYLQKRDEILSRREQGQTPSELKKKRPLNVNDILNLGNLLRESYTLIEENCADEYNN